MYQANFRQALHGPHKIQETTGKYETYEQLLSAIETYLQGVMNRFMGEMFEVYYTRDRNQLRTLPELMTFLKDSAEACHRGRKFTIYLELDGSTEYGNPILQTITFIDSVAHDLLTLQLEEEYNTSKRRYHYCGDPECDWDCGVLDCGCIDICRKFSHGSDY